MGEQVCSGQQVASPGPSVPLTRTIEGLAPIEANGDNNPHDGSVNIEISITPATAFADGSMSAEDKIALAALIARTIQGVAPIEVNGDNDPHDGTVNIWISVTLGTTATSAMPGNAGGWTTPVAYPYDVLPGDMNILVDCSADRTIRFPATHDGHEVKLFAKGVDANGAGAHPVTLVGLATTIVGTPNFTTINIDSDVRKAKYDLANATWRESA